MQQQCKIVVVDRKVLAMVDSSTLGFENKKNRIKDFDGLSRVGKNSVGRYFGLKLHPVLVYDQKTKMMLGISSCQFVKRATLTNEEQGDPRMRFKLAIEDKESYKWISACEQSSEVLAEASHVTYVMDREADIIELLDRVPNDKTSLVVRIKHDRYVHDQAGNRMKLSKLFKGSKVRGHTSLQIDSKKRKKREARMDICYERVIIPWGKNKETTEKRMNPQGIPMTVVQIKESQHEGYASEPELVWKLYTTENITNLQQALQIVDIYKSRWLIEEFFKLIKTDGYNIEATELTTGKAIRKLTLYVMKSSVKVQQLKAARDGKSIMKITQLFTDDEVECLKLLNKKVEGRTIKQQNPHPSNSIGFASWVIARLGGWKGFYKKSNPPGTKTFVWGLEKFENLYQGYQLKDVS